MKNYLLAVGALLVAGPLAACPPGSAEKQRPGAANPGTSGTATSGASAGDAEPVRGELPQAQGKTTDQGISRNWDGMGSTGGGTGTGTSVGTTAPPEDTGGAPR